MVLLLALTSSLAAGSEGQAADCWDFALPLRQMGVPPPSTVRHLLLPEPIGFQDSGDHARAYVSIGEKASGGLPSRRSRRWGRRGPLAMCPTGHGREEGTRGGRDIVGKDRMSEKSP